MTLSRLHRIALVPLASLTLTAFAVVVSVGCSEQGPAGSAQSAPAATATAIADDGAEAGADSGGQADANFDTHHGAKTGQSPVQVDRAQAVQATAVTMKLDEISCEGCEAMCEEQLTGIDGVKAAKPDKDTELIQVALDPGKTVTFGQLIEAVEARGFLVQSIQSAPEAQ